MVFVVCRDRSGSLSGVCRLVEDIIDVNGYVKVSVGRRWIIVEHIPTRVRVRLPCSLSMDELSEALKHFAGLVAVVDRHYNEWVFGWLKYVG